MSIEKELLESAIEYLYDLQGAWLWKENEVAGNGEEYDDLANLIVKIRDHLAQTEYSPKFDQKEFDELVERGTKIWNGVDIEDLK